MENTDKTNDIIDMDIKTPEVFREAEWCYQFDNDEPVILTVTPVGKEGDPLSVNLSINNTADSNITFSTETGKLFRLFSRPITEKGVEFRANQQLKNIDETEN
jgi:hypothetical protein